MEKMNDTHVDSQSNSNNKSQDSISTTSSKNLKNEFSFKPCMIIASISFLLLISLKIYPDYRNVIFLWFFLCFLIGIMVYIIVKFLSKSFDISTDKSKDNDQIMGDYNELQNDLEKRCTNYAKLVTDYYEVVTDWYEFGWGKSFQLGGGQLFEGEAFQEGCRRHEYWIAHRGGIQKNQVWLDLGCGVGGPMKNIARFTEAKILGVNLSDYQIKKAKKYIDADEGVKNLCSAIKCDFQKLNTIIKPNSYDGAYALEAICHSPDKLTCYRSIYEVLKPGGIFVCYEWALTKKFDPTSKEHQYARRNVEILGGIPTLQTTDEILNLIKESGLEIIEFEDLSCSKFFTIPWYKHFDSSTSWINFNISALGIQSLHLFLVISEFFGFISKGTATAHKALIGSVKGAVLAGKLKIFTPHFYIKARKPE